MSYLVFLISTSLILGIVGHSLLLLLKDANAVYGMNVATAKKKMFGSNMMVSTSTVKKELRRQCIINTVGIVLGILTIIAIVNIAGHRIFNIFIEGLI